MDGYSMLRKLPLVVGAAALLATLGYTGMAFRMVMGADAATVVSFASSETLPLAPRVIANWRVDSWDGCPITDRQPTPLNLTLRAYGMQGFDKSRVLATAEKLIELGCDTDQRNLNGYTAMHEAILYNEADVVRFLLKHGADPAVTIQTGDNEPSESRRFFSGMNAMQFTEELQRKSAHAVDRSGIVKLLEKNRS